MPRKKLATDPSPGNVKVKATSTVSKRKTHNPSESSQKDSSDTPLIDELRYFWLGVDFARQRIGSDPAGWKKAIEKLGDPNRQVDLDEVMKERLVSLMRSSLQLCITPRIAA